ncbi:MAG: restriction endonuclease subunit S [Selenomonadaceae bacterium]|nr:restriction endonuclease subunit S [Selenomonadaceae bacterium]
MERIERYCLFKEIFKWEKKSNIKSGAGSDNGKYVFFICSDENTKRYTDYLDNGEALVFGTGGKASCHYINGKYAYSTDCVVAKTDMPNVYLKFYYYFLRKNRLSLIQQTFRGTGLQHSSKKRLEEIMVPVLSYEEQKRIVSRIEELFSELDNGVENLKKVKAQLDVYRQAVLKEAFDIVDGKYIALKEIANSRLGKMLDKNKNEGIPRKYIRNANVRWLKFDLSDLQLIKIKDDEIDKYTIKYNDLVICEGGEPGRCAVWDKKEEIFYQKALHRVRFNIEATPKFYMYYFWLIKQTGFINKYYTGSGIKHLTGNSLDKIPVPNIGIDLQNKIVDFIEEKLSACENIEKTIDTALQQAETMRQSILKQAFEGGL